MSVLLAGRRSATNRRFSQSAIQGTNCQMQWPLPATLRHESVSKMGRRRALDIYDTKDILFTHEQMKKAKQRGSNTGNIRLFG